MEQTDGTPTKRRKLDHAPQPSLEDLEAKSKMNEGSKEDKSGSPRNGPTLPVGNDEDWIRSRTSRLLGLVDEDEEDLDSESIAEKSHATERKGAQHTITEADTTSEKPREDMDNAVTPEIEETSPTVEEECNYGSSRLFVRNLPYTATKEDIRTHFQATDQGAIDEVGTVFFEQRTLDKMNILIGTSDTIHGATGDSILVDAHQSDPQIDGFLRNVGLSGARLIYYRYISP